jgi:flagellar basal-body rod protein FlgB
VIEGLFSGNNYLAAKKLLDAAALRQSALASNIANVETPGYKRVDVDASFETQLVSATRKGETKELKLLQPQLAQQA